MRYAIERTRWIWHKEQVGANNVYLHFRKVFDLHSARIKKANIQIAAFSIYELYINGKLIGRGPIQGPFHSPYFDCYDVSTMLKKGRNVLAALVYNFGEKMPVDFLTNKLYSVEGIKDSETFICMHIAKEVYTWTGYMEAKQALDTSEAS